MPANARGAALDMGAGTGAAGLAAADRCPALRVDLAERDPVMLEALRLTLGTPSNRSLARRVGVLPVDLAAPAAVREAAGLRSGRHAHALANPPFNPASHRASPDARRAAAHGMDDATLEHWCRSAAHALAPGGTLAMILRPASLPELLAAWSGRFGGPALRPVHTRAGAATRVLARGRKGGREAPSLLPSLVVDGTLRAALGEGSADVSMSDR